MDAFTLGFMSGLFEDSKRENKKEDFSMEDYAFGSLKDGPDKKTDTKENPAFEHVKEMIDAGLFSSDSKSDFPWFVLMLLLVFGGPKPCGGSEYWRGKYEALKEVYDKDNAALG